MQINTFDLIRVERIPGIVPGGKYRVTANRRYFSSNTGGFSSTQYLYSGNPSTLAAIIDTNDSYSFGASKTRVITTRAPVNRAIPGEQGAGLIVAEILNEEYSYGGGSGTSGGCVGDILSATLQEVVTQIQRRLGTFADYIRYLRSKGQTPDVFALVTASINVKSYKYDSKGRTISITESILEDPRALAGSTKGIDWTTQIVSGPVLTSVKVQSWKETRRNDWEYSTQEYDAWCRHSPSSIPPNTPLSQQITPTLVESKSTTSTSQNQPPAAERAPARYSESTDLEEVRMNFSGAAPAFTPKERWYSFEFASSPVGLWELGTIAAQHEYGKADQIEVEGDFSDDWFTAQPYQSVRIDDDRESGIYAIYNSTFVLNSNECKLGFRGLFVAQIDANEEIQRPYITPSISVSGASIFNLISDGAFDRPGKTILGANTFNLTSVGSVRKVRTISGESNFNLISTGTARIKPPVEVSGTSSFNLISVATTVRVRPISGTNTFNLTSSGSARRIKVVSGESSFNLNSTGTVQIRLPSVLNGANSFNLISIGSVLGQPSARPPATQTVTTATIAQNTADLVVLDMSKTWVGLVIETSAPAEVRIYQKIADQAADLGRATTTQPTVRVLQATTTAGNLIIPVDVKAVFGSTEVTRTALVPATIFNRGTSSAAITLTFTYLPLEI